MTNRQKLQTPTPTRTRKRILLGAAAGVMAGLVGFGAVGLSAGAAAPAPTTPAPTSSTLLEGVYAGAANPSGISTFDAATGTHASIATDYLPGNAGFAGMDGSGGSLNWLLGPYQGSGLTLSLGVPIVPTNSSGTAVATLAAGATGAYNSSYVTLAQTLVAAGEANAYLRLGWEFDGGWMPWNATTPSAEASYAAYFDQIVTAMRSVSGAAFRFVWNPDAGAFTQSGYNVALAYPGSAFVNVIGLDAYDQTWVSPQTPTNAWNQTTLPTLTAAEKFASAQGKPLAFTEWGVSVRSDGHGLGDDPLFITNMAAWMHNPANNVAFETYFDANSGGVNSLITGGSFPNALAAFRIALNSSAPTTTAPVTPVVTPPVVVPVPVTLPAKSAAPTAAPTAPTTAPTTVPGAKPTAVTASTAKASGTTVALTWSNPTGTTGNRIYINGVLRTTLATAAVSYSDANAPTGWHTYNVTATNASGEGAESNSVTLYIAGTPAAAPPTSTSTPQAAGAAVTGLSVSVSGTTATLTWTNPSGASSNHIYYNGVLRTTLGSAVSGYTDVNPPSGWHTYNVTANRGNSQGAISNSVTVYIP